jgi:DNA invertase Pin-like site-specific DNA recombinase
LQQHGFPHVAGRSRKEGRGLIAAIYARKSTAQEAGEARSVERQIQHCREFAAARGWKVDERYIFVDDGISGAEFGERRPGLQALMSNLEPFEVLLVLSRRGSAASRSRPPMSSSS